jgi:hypothetical protein
MYINALSTRELLLKLSDFLRAELFHPTTIVTEALKTSNIKIVLSILKTIDTEE